MTVYDGEWFNDLPQGKGRLLCFQNRYYYDGYIHNGIMNGLGKIEIIWEDCQLIIYQGFFIKNICVEWLEEANSYMIEEQKYT